MQVADAASRSTDKVPVRHRVHAVGGDPAEAELVRYRAPVERVRRASDRAAAQRHRVGHFGSLLKPLYVPAQHLKVGEQVVGEEHGLAPLKVRVTRQDHIDMRPGRLHDYLPEPVKAAEYPGDRLPGVHPHVEGDLVVA